MLAGSIFSRGDAPIGVELHAGGVRMLQARRTRQGLCVRALGRAEVDWKGRGAEDQSLLEELAAAAGKLRAHGGFSGSRCVVGLDGRAVRTRSVRQPKLEEHEVEKAVALEAASRLGFAEGEGCQFGWLRAGEVRQGNDTRDELVYVGARREPVEGLLRKMVECGLQPIAVEPAFTATARCFTRALRRSSDEQTARIIVDIGEATTEVIVTRGRHVAFYKQVEIGGRSMTRAAAERLGLEPATVLDLRRRRMSTLAGGRTESGLDAKVDRALFDAVRPVISDLAHEATLCLRYYSVTFRGTKPESAVVVGEDAFEPNLASSVGEALHLPTQPGRPLDGLDTSRVAEQLQDGSSPAEWGAALGLSTRLIEQSASRRGDAGREKEAA